MPPLPFEPTLKSLPIRELGSSRHVLRLRLEQIAVPVNQFDRTIPAVILVPVAQRQGMRVERAEHYFGIALGRSEMRQIYVVE